TTEVNKVPVTVLSRCQRFDLRRIPAPLLAEHFARVVAAEGAQADAEALALIARAAEGSARDGLSILDQAIAHADLEGGGVRADVVREMLGLSDRNAVRDLLALVLAADAPGALAALRRQYDLGVDPQGVMRGLLEAVHGVTQVKVGASDDAAQPAEERAAYRDWAGKLSFPALHRLWQLFLKGHEEVGRAALPIETAEMAILRAIHASTLPDPGELARRLAAGDMPVATPSAPAAPPPPTPEDRAPKEFAGVLALLDERGKLDLLVRLRRGASLVRYAPPEIVFSGTRPLSTDTLTELAAVLREATGSPWKLAMADLPGAPTMFEAEQDVVQARHDAARAHPIVAAAFDAFPGAELIDPKPAQRSIT
ncbi:DNA polymerase III subunit gamma/tau, partial [uncultured Sphingomonas sp.]|uniref:DNA polymerase III subunit gamma/tau n=1 Tax=uncultured Sphingomonas sp. TaxID=158754 RepID=UPI0030FA8BA6